ncbi:MAG: hypothetical protein H0V07_02040 [Propionibacteriales bacterium]|nr:hypothetical protein [Propionibacteriales bacterium]
MTSPNPERRIGPASNGTEFNADISTGIKIESTVPDSADEIAQRRAWAYALIRQAETPAPLYGSPEFNSLAMDDPRRVASCVRAAEAWAQDGDELPERLADEIAQLRLNHKGLDDAEYVARAEAHRVANRAPSKPTFAQRRAAQLAAIAPRPGDFPGTGASS